MNPDTVKSWVVEIFEKRTSIKGIRNGLRFDTEASAQWWLDDLSMRWFGFDHGVIVETTEVPNYSIVDGKLTSLITESGKNDASAV